MASATMMGLRRRAPVNSSPTPSSHSPSTGGSSSSSSSSSKRSRNENNNSPSHGNLNSMTGRDEPPTKKSRGTSTSGAKGNSACASANSSPACSASTSTSSSTTTSSASTTDNQSSKGRGAVSRSAAQTKSSSTSTATSASSSSGDVSNGSALSGTNWPTTSNMSDMPSYASVTGLSLTGGQTAGLCAGSLGMPPAPIAPYMSTSIATFVGTATNLGKSSSVSYLDISNMTGGSLAASGATNSLSNGYGAANGAVDPKSGIAMSYSGMPSPSVNGGGSYGVQKGQGGPDGVVAAASPRKFQNDAMFNAYQPWVIKTYGDLAKTKTITIKKYARILRTLRGEEANSAENSKFRFWVKNKGFHIGQPDGYDAKPADRIIGRHAVTSPGLDPPLYVPAMLPHNKSLNGAEGTVPQGKVYKKVAIVENFFDIIHAVHVDLEGRPGKHAGQKRTYRTITETYAFLPREAVTRFLLGCTECQRRPRTPSPTNLSNQSQSTAQSTAALVSAPLNSNTGGGNAALTTLSSASSAQSSSKPRDSGNHHAAPSEGKNLHNYRHQKQHKNSSVAATDKLDKDKEEKYNPLSITNLLKKEPAVNGGFLANSDNLPESRRTPESDRASSRSSASSKRKRMLPEGRTPSPQPSQPLPRPWSPGLDPKNTPIDYSRPITTSYLKHQQKLLQAEKSKAAANALRESEVMELNSLATVPTPLVDETESAERERFSPATGLIGTNLKILGTIPHLHFQVMLALTERLRPSIAVPSPLVLPPAPTNVLAGSMIMGTEVSVQTGENHS